MGDVTVYQPSGGTLMTAEDIRNQVNRVQEVMRAVMRQDMHYGVIPGTQKPTLYKAGSEVLLTTFHIAVDPQVEELREGVHIRYRVRCIGTHQASGVVVGVGIGECSTSEDKYAWRRSLCDEEFEATDAALRRVKYQKYKGNVEKVKQIRTNPADLSNTVLKMAKKRAQIDLCLTATAASDIFTQDIEDLPEELRDREEAAPVPALPPETVEQLKATLNAAKHKGELRDLLKKAMAAAQTAQDTAAHAAIKAYGTTLAANLPDAPVEEPTQ